MSTRRRDERGAYAVMYGLLSVILLGMAGLAVDIGNATARKSDVQGQADFGALAAAQELGASYTPAIKTAVYQVVADSMNQNAPLGRTCTGCIQPEDLWDADFTDGEVSFTAEGVRVYSPVDRVDFGFANVLGFSNTDVQGSALVDVFSPKIGTMPMYAVPPCDYGRQTLTDPSHDPATTIPPLAYDADTNATELVPASSSPTQIDVGNPLGLGFTLTGKRWDKTYQVGFFPEDGTTPVIADSFTDQEFPPITHANDGSNPYTTSGNTANTVTLAIPTAVANDEQVWYVRVLNQNDVANLTDDTWSDKDEAPRLLVGDPVLECGAGSLGGNFGTLRLERSDTTSVNDDLALNIAADLQLPTSLTIHQTVALDGECAEGQPASDPAVITDLPNPGLSPKTNCVQTDPGLPANAATMGLVTGLNDRNGVFHSGRLTTAATTPGCGPGGSSSNRTVVMGNGANAPTYHLNNDTLTCFLPTGVSLTDITQETYSGEKLDESILDSPRFFLVPVLEVQPEYGFKFYSIVDFRPAFITDELVLPSSVKGSNSATADNGVYFENNGVVQIRVIFFDFDAIPISEGGDVIDYLGVGPKLIRLID